MEIDCIKYFQNDFKFILPELFLSLSILVIILSGIFFKSEKNDTIKSLSWLSIQFFLIGVVLLYFNPFNNNIIFSGMLIINNLTSILKIILLLSSSIVLFISFNYFKNENFNTYEYPILISLSSLGIIFLINSYDLIIVYLTLELQSLSLYVLASLKRHSEYSTEAGLKYFILGALSSGLFLFGCSLIYGFTGSTNFEILNILLYCNLFNIDHESIGILIGMILVSVGFLFKIAAAPFHMWAPDVYQGAPMIITAFFAIVPKIAVLSVFLLLFLEGFFGLMDQWQPLIVITAISSMIFGTLGALAQNNIKRFLAYSAVAHMGYVLISIVVASVDGIQSLLLYMIVYIIMSINIFTGFLCLYKKNDNLRTMLISDLKGLSYQNPLLAITIALAVLSMAGIPPCAGFVSKLYVFLAAINTQMYLLALLGVLASVIGAAYYIRVIEIMYFRTVEIVNSYKSIDLLKSLILAISILFIFLLVINPSYLLLSSHQMALNFIL
jgi:NADH-quinone oxidoreductase subunit N